MYINRTNDKMFPYVIADSWRGKVYGDLQDLHKLKEELNTFLEEELEQCVTVRFNKKIEKCVDCPFCHTEMNYGGPNGEVCSLLTEELDYGAFIPNANSGIHKKCPYRIKKGE